MTTFRIGLFDSRAVAIAYGNSELFSQHLSSLTAAYGEQALKWIEDGRDQVPIPIEEITFDID